MDIRSVSHSQTPRKLTESERKEIKSISGMNTNAELKREELDKASADRRAKREEIMAKKAASAAFNISINSGFSPRPYPNSLGKSHQSKISGRRIKDRVLIDKSTPEWRLSELARIQKALRNGSYEKGTIDWLLSYEESLKKKINEDNKKKE